MHYWEFDERFSCAIMCEFDDVIHFACECHLSLRAFAKFVAQIEGLPSLFPEYFSENEDERAFRVIWLDLEILNALALEDWVRSEEEWSDKYQEEARIALLPLIDFLGKVNRRT